MSVSDSQRAASNKWDKAHMTTVGCKVTKEKAQQFREACERLGTRPNAVLLQAVNQTIESASE